MKTISLAERFEIIRMHANGFSIEVIANNFGMTESVVRTHLSEMGLLLLSPIDLMAAWKQIIKTKNAERFRISSRNYYSRNSAERLAKAKAWRRSNSGKMREYFRARYKENIQHRLACVLRSRITIAFSTAQKSKGAASIPLLGCSIAKWKLHLESKFQPGMTWDNYGTAWEIDHIIPVSAYDLTSKQNQKAAFHYLNTQPLTCEENSRKGARFA